MRRPLAAALTAALVLTTAACGGGDGDGSDGSGEGIAGLTVTGEVGEEPTVETTEDFGVEERTGEEIVEGDGEQVGADSALLAKVGIFDDQGTLLSGNYAGNGSERITLGQDTGPFVEELDGARIGSRIAVAVPVVDVLGPAGAPDAGLAPEDTMLYVVDVIGVAPPPLTAPEGEAVDPPAGVPAVVGDEQQVTALDFDGAPAEPPTKFRVVPLIRGEGAEVQEGQQVSVQYFGAVWGKGDDPFDSSYERGEPITFQLSPGNLIEGWVEGLAGVPVGSRVMLIIPPDLGYGAQGGGPEIPGGATLVFVIDVLDAF